MMDSLLTLTMPPEQYAALRDASKLTATRRAILMQLKRKGHSSYVWVREYTARGTLHWHVFLSAGWNGRPDLALSREWSERWYKVTRRHGIDCPKMATVSARAEGLVRPAGAYAAKEASKQVQKDSDDTGMAWWRGSRDLKCEATGVSFRDVETLAGYWTTENGARAFIPYKVQHGGTS